MTYFLDFDRALFDNDAFQKYLGTLDAPQEIQEKLKNVYTLPRDGTIVGGSPARENLWREIETWFGENFSFKKEDLRQFVFPDVFVFLKEHGQESLIITTSRIPSFHEAKVHSSGLTELVMATFFVPQTISKAAKIQEIKNNYPAPYVFIDDLAAQLDLVSELCPDVSLYQILRGKKEGSGRYPVIRTLFELP